MVTTNNYSWSSNWQTLQKEDSSNERTETFAIMKSRSNSYIENFKIRQAIN